MLVEVTFICLSAGEYPEHAAVDSGQEAAQEQGGGQPQPLHRHLMLSPCEMVVWCEDKQQWRLSGAEEKAASNNVRLMVDGTRCGGGGTISLI